MNSLLLHKSKSLLHSKYEILIKYTLVPSIPLSIIAILSANPNTWVASEIHHFYIELIAVILVLYWHSTIYQEHVHLMINLVYL